MKRKTLGEIMSPSEMKLLEDIRLTAERQAAAQRPRVSGSPTAKNFVGDDIIANIAGPLGVPKTWAQSAIAENLVSRPATWALKSSEERLNDMLLRGLLDPQFAAELASKSSPSLLALRSAKALENSAPITQGLLGGYASQRP